MRLIQPAHTSFRHFRRRQVIITSNEALSSVLIHRHKHNHGSYIKLRGTTFAASPVPSDTPPEARKPHKRVSKHERRSMVENFVNKYRDTNAGKYPTVSMAQREVGGGYYILREIIQELKYNSNMLSTGTMVTTSMEKGAMKDDISTEAGEPVSKVDPVDSSCKSLEPKKEQLSSVSFAEMLKDEDQSVSDNSKKIETQSHHLTDELRSSLDSDPQTSIKQETSEDKVKFDDKLQQKAEPQQSSKSERKLQKIPSEDSSLEKSSMWHNLKSFANGIFDLWRR